MFRSWKFLIHILFGTYKFGVDNQWRSSVRSMYGVPSKDRFNLFKIIQRYKMARTRAFCGFVPLSDAVKMFPIYARRNGYK